MKTTIAVILTCHNRKNKTLACLDSLFISNLPDYLEMEVFLVDDGSTDKTSDAVKELFSHVNIIQGNGNLFWNQGMRLAWQMAAQTKDFDFYLWLNDDTILDPNALKELLKIYLEAKLLEQKEVIITAACRSESKNNMFSYGGRNDDGPVIPNGKLQSCKYINGNVVLIPKFIFNLIGNLSNDYSHGMGDYDYGLRALQKGFKCYTTRKFIATCPSNQGIATWCNPEKSLINRWQAFHSPLGLNIKEYIVFRKKFWKYKWAFFLAKAYIKMIFPRSYKKLQKL
jgi:GT2 family glycosyltransferase